MVMEYYSYFLLFPEGDRQEIYHPLKFGDIVDINGNVCSLGGLSPKKIAYKVTGVQQKSHFKEVAYFYRVELLNRDEVIDEMLFLKNRNNFY